MYIKVIYIYLVCTNRQCFEKYVLEWESSECWTLYGGRISHLKLQQWRSQLALLLKPSLSWWCPSQSLAASFQSCDVPWHPWSASISIPFRSSGCFARIFVHFLFAGSIYVQWMVDIFDLFGHSVGSEMVWNSTRMCGMGCWQSADPVIVTEGENVVAVEYSKVPFCCCRPDFSFEKRFWSGQTAMSTVELMNRAICLFSVGRYGQYFQMIHLLLPWFAVLLSCILTMSSLNSGSAALWCSLLLTSLQQHSA